MKRIILVVYILLVVVMAIATFVEYGQGASFVAKHIYQSTFFVMSWTILAVLTMGILFRLQMWKRFFCFLLHLSFIVILLGAAVSFKTSRKGFLHLRMGGSTFQFVEQDTHLLKDMPFVLRLDTFGIAYYPGTEAPSDFVSEVTCLSRDGLSNHSARISMNHILEYQGYRFYQSSYDEDGRGSWLDVNYDPWGTAITYIGYLLFAISMLGLLFSRRNVFWKLLHHPALKQGMIGVLMCFVCASSYASSKEYSVISIKEADSLSVQQVIYHDRVVPFNTLAIDFVKKLSGKENFNGLTPEQVVGSWMKYPEEWKYVPIIKMKNAELCHLLNLEECSYSRLVDLLDGEHDRLSELLQFARQSMDKFSLLEKAILETDEKVALIEMLLQGSLVRPIPVDGSVKPLSSVQVEVELLYNRIPFSKILFMFNLTLGVLSLGWVLSRILKSVRTVVCNKSIDRMMWNAFHFSLFLSFLFHAFGYILRWYIGGRIPLSNGYETMQFVALVILALAFYLRKRLVFMVPFGFLLSGFVLLVAYLGQMNPQITPLVPVLVSPWLSTHVSFIMIAYAFLAFICLNGWLGLFLPREAGKLQIFSRILLYPSMFFLGVGIFIGAVWANVSWGRYWSWDPKEVWALITFMVYGVPFHCDSLSWLSRPKYFHLYMVLAFFTVLMTYFGVSFFLGGMHSYA